MSPELYRCNTQGNIRDEEFKIVIPTSDKKTDDTLPRRPNTSLHRKCISEQQMLVF
jgi:hypothetical protein